MARTQVEDVEGRGEQEGELQGRADWQKGVCVRVVRGEDRDVEGVVLRKGGGHAGFVSKLRTKREETG